MVARNVETGIADVLDVVNTEYGISMAFTVEGFDLIDFTREEEDALQDYANKKIPADYKVCTDNIQGAVELAHKFGLGIIVIGALTSATNNFGDPQGNRKVLVIEPKKANGKIPQKEPCLYNVEKSPVKSNEVILNKNSLGEGRHTIIAGVGLTIAQLNEFLNEKLGADYWIPVDPTTVGSALLGGAYATGAQGTTRMRISDVAQRVWLHNGEYLSILEGEDIEKNQGLIGLNGAALAIEIEVPKVPMEQFGGIIPIKKSGDWSENTATLLSKLNPYLNVQIKDGEIVSDWEGGFLTGAELITSEGLDLVLKKSKSESILAEAGRLKKFLESQGSDFALMIKGFSNLSLGEMLEKEGNPITDMLDPEMENIIGEFVALEGSRLDILRDLREEVTDCGKREAKGFQEDTKFISSTTTDINFGPTKEAQNNASLEELRVLFKKILQPYVEYERTVREIAEEFRNRVEVTLYRYGHFNPKDMDPHFRVTAKGDIESEFGSATLRLAQAREELINAYKAMGLTGENIHVGPGEKRKVFSPLLTQEQQAEIEEIIAEASQSFNYRLAANITMR